MADIKTEASALYYTTKVDASMAMTRNELMKLVRPDGTAGPALTALLAEFYSYAAAWDDAKKSANPDQLEALSETILANLDAYVARGRQAKAMDDTKTIVEEAKKQSKPAPARPAAPAAPAAPPAPAPGAAPAAPPPPPPAAPAAAKSGLSTDTMLLVAAAGLGAAALLYGGKKR